MYLEGMDMGSLNAQKKAEQGTHVPALGAEHFNDVLQIALFLGEVNGVHL